MSQDSTSSMLRLQKRTEQHGTTLLLTNASHIAFGNVVWFCAKQSSLTFFKGKNVFIFCKGYPLTIYKKLMLL